MEKRNDKLMELLKNKVEYYCSQHSKIKVTSTEAEQITAKMLGVISESCPEFKIRAIEYKESSHAFPDIIVIFDNHRLGIEVKSSTQISSSWSILGNSVAGGTCVDFDSLYVFFLKSTRKGILAKVRRYEDVVESVVVTHSPRYRLDLDLEPGQTFFDKLGITYNEFKTSDDPIRIVTDYYRAQGETAWWLTESAPPTIRMWSDLPYEEQKKLQAYALILFPEIIYSKNNRTKYKRLATWLITKHSILHINLRDTFTAGGRVKLLQDVHGYSDEKLAKVCKTIQDSAHSMRYIFDTISLDELMQYWPHYYAETDNLQNRIEFWKNLILKGYQTNTPNCSEMNFIKNLNF